MLLTSGDKVLVCHRRLFEKDQSRYFIGEVEDYEHGLARVAGYTWIRDQINGLFQKRNDLKTKILSLSSGTLIWYILSNKVDHHRVIFEQKGNEVWLSDHQNQYRMDLTEGLLPHAPAHPPKR